MYVNGVFLFEEREMAVAAADSVSLSDTFNNVQQTGRKLWHGFHKYIMFPSMLLMGAGMAYQANKLDTGIWDVAVGFFQHSVMGFDIMTGGLGSMGLAAANFLDDFEITSELAAGLAEGAKEMIADSAISTMPEGFHLMSDGSLMANNPSDIASASLSSGVTENVVEASAQIFSNPMDWFNTLPEVEQITMRQDAIDFGIPFDEYVADWCANNHVPLSSPSL